MTTTAPAFVYDYFISRRGSVAAVAQEVADILEAANYKVKVQDYDFNRGGNFVLDIHDALRQCQHLLILHTEDYDSTHWTRQEFGNFLAAASQNDRRVGLLRCDAANPQGLFAGITRGDLIVIDDPDQRRDTILDVAEGRAPADRKTPRIFGGAMPLENRLFTGRDDLLTDLHTALSREDATAALTQAAVHGLGGVGKTSLARAYIARHDSEYAGVWWITAGDRQGALEGLADLGHELNPSLPPDTPPEQAARAALETIARRPVPFLLIYDNAPDPAALSGLLPRRGARVLITSRHPGWSRQAQTLPVAEMPEDEAIALLQRVANRQDEPGARRLARELGCLPLALDHAAAYARQTMTSFDDYATQAEALINQAGDNPDYPASVAATFQIAITNTPPASHALLGRLCWFAPEAIPLLLLDDDNAPAPERANALAALTNVSLLTRAPDTAAGPAVAVHRLVQAVMRNRLAASNDAEGPRNLALARLAEVFPYAFNDPGAWPLCRTLLPHVRTLEPRCTSDQTVPELATLLNYAASFLQGSGDASAALPLYRHALNSRERVLGAEHRATLTSVNNLAHCLQALGDASAALPLYRHALESRERVLGAEHPDTLSSVSNLAYCLRALGDTSAALPLYRYALESRERELGAEHPDTLSSVNNLASCLQALGDATAALPLCRRALDGCERVLGAEHPDTFSSVNNLALCLQTLGDASAALPLFRRALESSECVLGAEHPDTLSSVNNLAGCLQALGDASAALPLYRRALGSRECTLGAAHPDTLISMNNLAYCLQALGDPPAALPLFRRALEGRERVLGAEHPDALSSLSNLARCFETLGDASAALPLYRRALESRKRVLGAEHPDTLSSLSNLARCFESFGDTSAALPLYRLTLETRERVLGAAHPATLSSVNNLAGCLETLGDASAALPLYRRALESRERVLGAEHPATLISMSNLAYCLRALGDASAASPLYRRALAGAEGTLGPDHPTTKILRANLEIALQQVSRTNGPAPGDHDPLT